MQGIDGSEVAVRGEVLPRQAYVNTLRQHLAPEVFQPVARRLWWMLFYFSVVGLAVAVVLGTPNLLARFIAAVAMGHCLGVLGFLGHEILHGTVIRNRRLLLFCGGICMANWGIHPRAWIAWHNREHHQQTQHGFDDPDCFGREELYRHSKLLRILEPFTPGSGRLRSGLFLFFWFSFHAAFVIFTHPKLFQARRERWRMRIYLVATQVIWAAASLLAVGPLGILFLMVIPLAFSNFVMMSYVATNHFISPLTEDANDPLVNSLTVRSNGLVERFHLYNNFHVEHHVLPYVNPVHAPRIAGKLREIWPEKYQELSHLAALRRVYASPKFYKEDTVLINPRTRKTVRTLLAHYLSGG